jgi:hypothetical protein
MAKFGRYDPRNKKRGQQKIRSIEKDFKIKSIEREKKIKPTTLLYFSDDNDTDTIIKK